MEYWRRISEKNMSKASEKKGFIFPVFLLFYHLCFAGIAWQYILKHQGDALRYWNLTEDWAYYLNVGTDVIKWINYPFSEFLQLPLWAGFVLHSLVGYYAIYELYSFADRKITGSDRWNRYLLMLIVLLPNLHFWTAIIGKEPLILLATTWIIIKHSEKRFATIKYVVGWLLLVLIRPHVTMFLVIAIVSTTITANRKWTFKKYALILGAFLSVLGLYLMTMRLLNRNPWDIAYILKRNNASLIAFKRAGSYVPMIDYNWIERFFALNFRPFFADAQSWLQVILSVENLFVVLILIFALYNYIRHYKKVNLNTFSRIAIGFFLVSSLFFIQRYSCLGIFVRTKIMYMPFLLIAALQLINQIKTPPSKDQA
ncbi:hypothetical protein PQ459_00370 [Chryseobacterium sp. KACC 21268]|nr:hypothetical protein PQ459_00370 [Chryseobacterium sp. KACC 21268]